MENYFVRRSALMKSPGMKRSPLWLQAWSTCGATTLPKSNRRCTSMRVWVPGPRMKNRHDGSDSASSNQCFSNVPAFYQVWLSHFSGLAHRTAEKQRPGPLDLALLFQEVVKVKKISRPTASMRELLLGSIQEYNRTQTTKAWKVSETDRKLIYNCIRSPVLLAALKLVSDRCPWQHSAFTMENLDGDFYVPNSVLAPNHVSQTWKEIKDRWFWIYLLLEFNFLNSGNSS